MKAVILTQAGGVENLKMEEVARPEIKSNEVLVAVKSIGLNPADVKPKYVEPMLTMMFGSKPPIILGWDIAGIVDEVGSEVTKFKKGDKVFGMVNFPGVGNAYAEYVASPENHLAKMPDNVSFEEASAATLAALTALQLMQETVQKGDRILIHGGSGGVGHYAVQIAKSMGAYVYTTASTKNHDFVLSLGADEHIDYKTQDFEQEVSELDVVFDMFGGEILDKSLNVLRNGGTILSTLMPGALDEEESMLPPLPQEVKDKIKTKNITANPFLVTSNGKDMETIAEMMKNGSLKSHIHVSFPFEKMAEAHTTVEKGGLQGKVVVTL